MNETYFGDKDTFAIRYVPGFKSTKGNSTWHFGYLHLVLGGKVIGCPTEVCLIGTWMMFVEDIQKQLEQEFDKYKNPEFVNRPDNEIFELIRKANQLEEEYNPQYSHLPVLDEKLCGNYDLSLDETIDAWLITMTEDNGQIKFIWEGWRDPCPEEDIGKLYSITVDRTFVIETIRQCLKQVNEEYPHYSDTIPEGWD